MRPAKSEPKFLTLPALLEDQTEELAAAGNRLRDFEVRSIGAGRSRDGGPIGVGQAGRLLQHISAHGSRPANHNVLATENGRKDRLRGVGEVGDRLEGGYPARRASKANQGGITADILRDCTDNYVRHEDIRGGETIHQLHRQRLSIVLEGDIDRMAAGKHDRSGQHISSAIRVTPPETN